MSSRSIQLIETASDGAPAPFSSGMEHLLAELDWLRLLLHRHVLRLKAANILSSDPFRGLYLADDQVDAVLHSFAKSAQAPEARANAIPEISELTAQARDARADLDARIRASTAAGVTPPLPRLAALFHLSPLETKAIIAAAAVEFDLRFESLYSWARNDVTRRRPSVDLILKLLCASHDEELRARAAFRENAPLFAHRIFRIADEPSSADASFLARSIRLDERIVQFLADDSGIDKRLRPFSSITFPSRSYDSLLLPEPLRTELRHAARIEEPCILYLCGPRGSGKASAVEALGSSAARPLLVADLSQALHAGANPEATLALLNREAVLQQSDILLENAEALLGDGPTSEQFRFALDRMRPALGVRIYIAGDAPWHNGNAHKCAWHFFDFPVPSFLARGRLWQHALAESRCPLAIDADIQGVAERFALTGGAIHQACAEAARHLLLRGGTACTTRDLESAARDQSNHGLRRFGRKVSGAAGWNSLVAPLHILRQLRDVCTAERHRHTVYSQWGFDQRLSSGKGLNVLFCGASGTGKTLAAGIVAQDLGLDLYRVDLSIVVSKYIGETEKQLSQIFREAQTSNAVLLFDEADALFGKRSEVKDAHDRYANVEVAYLLQKMEEYEGIVILATNLRRNMDDAFTRRMHHIVEFPFPDADHRERIWKTILPPAAPLAPGVDFGFLARQFELAGGNIRNVALAAAFFAAEESSAIRMDHFIVATALELQKSGKLPSRSEFRDYYELIRSRT
jgi:hypothetical protein